MFANLPKPVARFLSVLLVLTVLLAGCASSSPQEAESQQGAVSKVRGESAPAVEAPAGADNTASQGLPDTTGTDSIDRIVIQNAHLSLAVKDPSASLDAISQLAADMGGFVVNANLYQQTLGNGVEVPRGSITIRVPAERLNEAMERIQGESEQEPLSKNVESQDVTSEYTDLQSRLRNLESTEVQLTKIMEEANRTEDVLQVYNRLVEVRENIEVIKGKIQYYQQASALSAISVELLADEAVQPLSIGGWQPVGVAKNAVQALINTVQVLVNTVIWIIIYALPVGLLLYLLLILPITLILRAWRRRRTSRKVVDTPSAG